jgi:Holliday junction DNA helicase RuvA
VELKEKLVALALAASPRPGAKRLPMIEQLEQALLGLGYRPQQAAQAADAVSGSADGRDLDELLREALKRLRG